MKQDQRVRTKGSLTLGWLGMIALPLGVIADTLWAIQRGWHLRHAGSFAIVFWLAVAVVAFAALLMLLPAGRRVARRATQWWLFSAGALAGLLLAEFVVLPILAPSAAFHRRLPNSTYVFNPDPFDMFNVSGEAHSTFNSLGLRGPELPAGDRDQYRILCIGGSATECYFLDDQECWTELLMHRLARRGGVPVLEPVSKKNGATNSKTDAEPEVEESIHHLRPWVGVAAVSEFASGHHLRFIRDYSTVDQVDCVLVMLGVNDFLRLLLQLDMGESPPPLWYRSRLLDLAREIWNVRFGHGIIVDPEGEQLRIARLGLPIAPHDIQRKLPAALDAYADRLRAIVSAAKTNGVRLVFVAQPALWDDFLGPQGAKRLLFPRVEPYPREWDYLQVGNFRDALEQYNARLETVARESRVEFVDVVSEMNGNERYFYDDFHLNERGCHKLATILADWFTTHPAPIAAQGRSPRSNSSSAR